MSRTPALVCLIAVLMAAPIAQAVPGEDPEGDVVLQSEVGEHDWTGPRWQAADLLRLSIEETVTDVVFELLVADLSAPTEVTPFLDNLLYRIDFDLGERSYRVSIFRWNGVDGQLTYGTLWIQHEEGYSAISEVPMVIDEAEGRMVVSVPRDFLRNESGGILVGGMTLENLFVEAFNQNPSPFGGRVFDRMPDEGFWSWTSSFGPEQVGNLHLSSPAPIQVSNGAAATYRFDVTAENRGETSLRAQWALRDQPATWEVFLPAGELTLAPQEVRTIPVLVSVPFAHQHGALETVLIELASQDGAQHVGRIQIGIHYTPVPQPAGHHDKLYLHTTALLGYYHVPYMNTLEFHDGDLGGPAYPTAVYAPFDNGGYQWDVFLQPALGMGLEFDAQRLGEVEVEFEIQGPMMQGWVFSELVLTKPSGEVILGKGEDQWFDVRLPGGRVLYSQEITIEPGVARIDHEIGANLILRLRLEPIFSRLYLGQEETTPLLLPGGTLNLPLFEYYEDVRQAFQELSGVSLEVVESASKRLPPGSVDTFHVVINNAGAAREFRVQAVASPTEWVTVSPSTVRIGAADTVSVDAIVRIPDHARNGDRLDLVIIAEDIRTGQRSAVNAAVIVDEDAPLPAGIPSISDGNEAQKSPGPQLAVVLTALAFVTIRSRKSLQ